MSNSARESSINKQSFFKLPLIFIGIFLSVYFVMMNTVILVTDTILYVRFSKNFVMIFLDLTLPMFLFFLTAVFCCQKYRLHSVSDSRLKITLIAILFALVYLIGRFLFSFTFNFFIEQLNYMYAMNYMFDILFWLKTGDIIINIVIYILSIVILNFLFYLFANKDASSRAMFKLEGATGSRVYSHIYSFLMLFFVVVFISFSLADSLEIKTMYLASNDIKIITLLVMFIALFIYYMIFYFSTYESFKRIDPIAKLGKLMVTASITYLFIFITNLVIVGVIANQVFHLRKMTLDKSALALFVIIGVINLLLFFIFSRRAVKITYG